MQKQDMFEEVTDLLGSQNIGQAPTLHRCQCNLQFSSESLAEIQGEYYCEDCLIKQVAIEKQEVQRLQEKYIFYKEYEASMGPNELAFLQEPLKNDAMTDEQLDRQQQQLEAVLNGLRDKQSKNNQTLSELKQKILDLDRQESKYWDSMNKFERKLFKLQEKASTAKWELKAATEEYERLQKFNVLSQTFRITCEGDIGYINGLAIGKKNRNRNDLDWEEINAGLGHLFVLFCYLVMKFEYQCVRLVDRECLGSCSKVRVGTKSYDIGYSRDREKEFGEMLDEWMLELELLKLHIDKTNERGEKIQFPYKIVIGEYKINGQFINPMRIKNGRWDVWTTSMKYFLTNFEYLSTVCSLADKFV